MMLERYNGIVNIMLRTKVEDGTRAGISNHIVLQ